MGPRILVPFLGISFILCVGIFSLGIERSIVFLLGTARERSFILHLQQS